VKAILVLGLLVVFGFAAAGCGAAKKNVSTVVTNPGTTAITNGGPVVPARPTITVLEPNTTVTNVKTGIWIRCKGWPAPGVQVPPRGGSLVANVGTVTATVGSTRTGSSSSEELRIRHLRNGSIRVVCKTG
jgi:hypothetical protein